MLAIEDEWVMADLVGRRAEQAGETLVDYADSESEATAAAESSRRAIILSGVRLRNGTGPSAVEAIQRSIGPVPVIFITSTPDGCRPCGHPAVVPRKPIVAKESTVEFRRLAGL